MLHTPPLTRRSLLALSAGALWQPGANAADGPTATVLMRLRSEYLATQSGRDADKFLAQRKGDGTWDDVDYSDKGANRWRPMAHLDRLRAIAVAANQERGNARGTSDSDAAVVQGLRVWLARKPQSTNWWHNTIGQQLALAPILVLMGDRLPPDLREQVTALLTDPTMVPAAQATAQNRIWYASQQVVRGALRGDAPDLLAGSQAAQSTIEITEAEGIQADYSFHQHSAQLYSGAYGLGFLTDITRIAGWLVDTPFAMAPAKLELLADYVLQGLAPLVRGAWLDWSACGREITRAERTPRTVVLAKAVGALAPATPNRSDDLRGLLQRLQNKAPQPGALGNRLFWRSDFMVHQTPAAYASVRMVSARTVGTESGNGENLLGYWLPFGVTYLVRRGDEYEDMPALWDWSALPGLTAPEEVPPFSGLQRHGERFVGGVSDGSTGLCAMRVDKFETQARKAWFFHGDWMVALGAGIQCSRPATVRTTVNQVRWRGSLQGPDGALPVQPGGKALTRITHDGITAYFGRGTVPTWQVRQRRIDGNPSNPDAGARGVAGEVFALYIDHGPQPRNAAYDYAIWMGAAAAPAQAAHETLVNDDQRQAVRFADGTVMAVFHGPGELAMPGGAVLRVGSACLVMVLPAAGEWRLRASDPTRSLGNLSLSWRGTDGRTLESQMALPAAESRLVPMGEWRIPRRA